MKIRSMQTCIMSSLPRCIFRCSVFRYVTSDNFFQTLLFIVISFTLVANKYLLAFEKFLSCEFRAVFLDISKAFDSRLKSSFLIFSGVQNV